MLDTKIPPWSWFSMTSSGARLSTFLSRRDKVNLAKGWENELFEFYREKLKIIPSANGASKARLAFPWWVKVTRGKTDGSRKRRLVSFLLSSASAFSRSVKKEPYLCLLTIYSNFVENLQRSLHFAIVFLSVKKIYLLLWQLLFFTAHQIDIYCKNSKLDCIF